jgi:MFS family permease
VVVGGAIGGLLIERLGLRLVLCGAAAVYGVAGSAGLYLESIWTLLGSRLIMGLAAANISTCLVLLVGAWFNGVARARLLGFQQASAGVIAVPALLLSGRLAENVGWRAPFAIYLFAFAIFAAALASIPSNPVPRQGHSRESHGSIVSLWPIYGLQMILMFAYFMSSIQLTFLLADDQVTSAVTRSIVIAVGTSAGGIAGFVYGGVFARLRFRWTRVFLIALMALGSVVIGASHSLLFVGVGVVVLGFGGGMIPPFMNGVMLANAPAEIRGRALSFMFTAVYTADFLNPIIVAPVREAIGIHGAFIASGIILIVVLAFVWRRNPVSN